MKHPGVGPRTALAIGAISGMLFLFLFLVPYSLFQGSGFSEAFPHVFLKCLALPTLLSRPEGQAFVFPKTDHVRSPCAFLPQLLPIPDSLPISPDDGQHADIYKLRIRVRGNLEWAPPRPQIIFNVHPAPM